MLANHIKRAVRRSFNNLLGIDVMRYPNEAAAKAAIVASHRETLRRIHFRDATEIEELYRHFVFPTLPRKEGRGKLFSELLGTSVGEAIYVNHHLHQALRVPGDVCEFGVAQGATSALLASELAPFVDRVLWLFDSFEGLPEPSTKDRLIDDIFSLGSMAAYKGTMACPEEEVRTRLAALEFPESRIMIKKGWVNETIRTGAIPAAISFAYVDLDLYHPIRDAL
jgi:O-methyltransferase